jgi:hypothetical protein
MGGNYTHNIACQSLSINFNHFAALQQRILIEDD